MKVCILCSSSAPQSVHIRPSGILNFITHFSSQQQGQSFCTKYLPERWKTRLLQYGTWQDWRTIPWNFLLKYPWNPMKTPLKNPFWIHPWEFPQTSLKLLWSILETLPDTPFKLLSNTLEILETLETTWNARMHFAPHSPLKCGLIVMCDVHHIFGPICYNSTFWSKVAGN